MRLSITVYTLTLINTITQTSSNRAIRRAHLHEGLIITHAWAWSKVWIVGATFKLTFLGWALTMRWLIVLALFWFFTEGVCHWTEGQNKRNKLNVHQNNPSKTVTYAEWSYSRAKSQLRRLSIFSINTSVIILPNHVSNGCLFYFACTTES